MGTRNVTVVINREGERKVAQYGQWDGYPSGLGVDLLNIFRNKELVDKFEKNLHKCRFLNNETDKEMIDDYNSKLPKRPNDPDNRTPEQKYWFETYMSRDLSAQVIENIANSPDNEKEIILHDGYDDGIENSLTEWCYIVDLKENKLKVYYQLDKSMIKDYDLLNLPNDKDFIKELDDDDGDKV